MFRTGKKHMDSEIKKYFVKTVYKCLSNAVHVSVRFTLKNYRGGRRDAISPCVAQCIQIISECEEIKPTSSAPFEVYLMSSLIISMISSSMRSAITIAFIFPCRPFIRFSPLSTPPSLSKPKSALPSEFHRSPKSFKIPR